MIKNNLHLRNLALAASLLVFLLIVFGAVSSQGDSTQACPGWPTCNGSWLPDFEFGAIVQYFHQLLTALTIPVVLLTTLEARRNHRNRSLVIWASSIALILLVVQIFVGATYVLGVDSAIISAIHFGLGLLTLGAISVVAVIGFMLNREPDHAIQFQIATPFSRFSVWSVGLLFVVLLSGVYVTLSQATFACVGWPLCNGELIPSHPLVWVNMFHRFLVAVGGLFMLALLRKAWQTQRNQIAILSAASITVVLYFSQGFVGALKAQIGSPSYLLGLHEVTSAALWVSSIVLAILMGLSTRNSSDEEVEAKTKADNSQRARDFLSLTKPIIVLLLLVTTYAGMVVAIGAIPSFSLTFWTLLGGALAAGGAGAVNQYIDRELDQQMTRTAKRPIAAGRLTPAEGMAYALSLLVISFYIYMGFVNMLAAFLAFAGMIYYIFLYSIWLKRATVQNIVIGGGAGAIPPMVGWAASSGGLDWLAWLLFAIIFMWTPPHFWALALVRSKDYARAGIPMLPVVRGEKYTRRQIFIYTLALVALTLVLPLLNLTGNVYLISALVLGLLLIYEAWKVLKVGGNSIAWRMYRYSSMYLAFLFLALVVDSLLK
jgi:protoheme IX farnesyltransferase